MEDIFEIKFPIEIEMKEKVILRFSNKQGGAFNIFSYYWQCFVWAATIGFLRNDRKPLQPGTDRIFSLNTMRGNGGDKDAQALICMCIARTGSIDIMKDPQEAIQVISEYANGGFYHILQLMENGENSFNDMEQVKQEIFSRDYWNEDSNILEKSKIDTHVSEEAIVEAFDDFDIPEIDEEAIKQAEVDFHQEKIEQPKKVRSKWTASERVELKKYYKMGMTVEQLAGFFTKSEDAVKEQLSKLGLL